MRALRMVLTMLFAILALVSALALNGILINGLPKGKEYMDWQINVLVYLVLIVTLAWSAAVCWGLFAMRQWVTRAYSWGASLLYILWAFVLLMPLFVLKRASATMDLSIVVGLVIGAVLLAIPYILIRKVMADQHKSRT